MKGKMRQKLNLFFVQVEQDMHSYTVKENFLVEHLPKISCCWCQYSCRFLFFGKMLNHTWGTCTETNDTNTVAIQNKKKTFEN